MTKDTCIIVTKDGYQRARVIQRGEEWAITECDVSQDAVCLTHLATGARIGQPEPLTTKTRRKLAALEALEPWDMRDHDRGYKAALEAVGAVS